MTKAKLTSRPKLQIDNETTAGHPDHREQLDLSTPHPIPGPDKPAYYNLLAPNQWPSAAHMPQFRPVFEEYMARMSRLSAFFMMLVAEALGMPPDAFARFFDASQQHKLKIVKYPEVDCGPDDDALARQGVGPHKDSMLTSYLLQASPQRGLQVQNAAGAWIDVPPIDGTLVVAFGQGLEALTGGMCASTTHRVLSPLRGEGPRFSVPFFQGVSYDARFEAMSVPDGVRRLRNDRRRRDDVEFTFRAGRWSHLGEATLANRIKSHPDVGERWVSLVMSIGIFIDRGSIPNSWQRSERSRRKRSVTNNPTGVRHPWLNRAKTDWGIERLWRLENG
jgi:isopenicillin N synthase-like dioxygenase